MANQVFDAARTLLAIRQFEDRPVPNGYDVLAVLAFGYPARPVRGIKKRKPLEQVASSERFGTPFSG